MGLYKSIRESVKNITPEARRNKLANWRRTLAVQRVARPENLARARSLGYRAKEGILVVRVRALRGGRRRPLIKKGRRPKNKRQKKVVAKNYQRISEERANKKYPNCEVLNSYWVAEDGNNIWYEIILVDKHHPVIKSRKELSWMHKPAHRNRVERGLTSAGRKSRGLRNKGKGAEKVRPSLRADSNKRRAH